jgi:hypothetical protein
MRLKPLTHLVATPKKEFFIAARLSAFVVGIGDLIGAIFAVLILLRLMPA